MPRRRREDHSDEEEVASSTSSFAGSSDGVQDSQGSVHSNNSQESLEVDSVPPPHHADPDHEEHAGSEASNLPTVDDAAQGVQIHEGPHAPSRKHKIWAWTLQQGKEKNNKAQKAMRGGIAQAKTVGQKAQQGFKDKVKRAKELSVKHDWLHTFTSHSHAEDTEELESPAKPLPENPKWLSPRRIKIGVNRPLPPHLRSLDLPISSNAGTYSKITYFPETDTHYLPQEEGGPFEIPAAKGENEKWIRPFPVQFWVFRSSALKELKHTGKLHWRETDRWGVPWEDSRWKGDVRPVWDPQTKSWDRSMMET